MDLYFKFLATMAVGLVGVGLVLQILLDELFLEWDAVADAKDWIRDLSHNHKGLLAQRERADDAAFDQDKSRYERREVLKQISDVERRLNVANHEITLTPLPRTPVSPEA